MLRLLATDLGQRNLAAFFARAGEDDLLAPQHCFKRRSVGCHALTHDDLVQTIATFENISRHLSLPLIALRSINESYRGIGRGQVSGVGCRVSVSLRFQTFNSRLTDTRHPTPDPYSYLPT